MSVSGSLEALVEQLLAHVTELETALAQRDQVIAEQVDRIAVLEGQVGADSANSSRSPSSDALWVKKPAKKRSSRTRSGRKPGKQPGSASVSRSLIDDPDAVFEVAPDRCARCEMSLQGAAETSRVRRQVVDVSPPPPPKVTEYQVVSRRCGGCGHVSEPTTTDVPRPVEPGTTADFDAAGDSDLGVAVALRPGSPVRIGPRTTALAVLLTCGHYLPVARATTLLVTMAGVRVSTGFTAGVRRRAAAALETGFLPHMRSLLRTAPVFHADETTAAPLARWRMCTWRAPST